MIHTILPTHFMPMYFTHRNQSPQQDASVALLSDYCSTITQPIQSLPALPMTSPVTLLRYLCITGAMLLCVVLQACHTPTLTPTPTPKQSQAVTEAVVPPTHKADDNARINQESFLISNNKEAPPAPREFRAAWVSTVANIDWPSRRDLSTEKQKAEIIAILDQAVLLKLNAIILQVRPSADAIYPSQLEPWSEYLTGTQGKAPDPWYDPLAMWVEQAHLRGIELHAWFNPYRVRSFSAKSNAHHQHLSLSLPTAVRQYGDMLWLDPSDPAAANATLNVIMDVVKRYAIDGVQIDDYFYPYPIKAAGQELEFPDERNWLSYVQAGGGLSRADWRRDHINRLVETLNKTIHQAKPWIKFGISPFGIGRPDRLPAGIVGFSQYDKLYADVELWLAKGWLDYLAPQLYWPIEQSPQAFKVLHDYWLKQNTYGRMIWPGLFTSRIDQTEKSWPVEEILNQVDATREWRQSGHIHFSMVALLQNRKNIRQRLQAEKYQQAALIPAMPWLGDALPATPELQTNAQNHLLQIKIKNTEGIKQFAIWKRYQQGWYFSTQSSSHDQIDTRDDPVLGALEQITVSSVSQTGQESARVTWTP